jgi:hypothetical protein
MVDEEPVYRVQLEGRLVGPYDRRTIVGMRIKKTLTSEHVLVAPDGRRLTVAELVKSRPGAKPFQPDRSGTYSLVQATFSASLLQVQGRGHAIPAFKGEIEARVQGDVLRMAGRFRQGMGWKEDRVKLPLADGVHARVRSSVVDLWLRAEGQSRLQHLALELFTPETAGEFVEWLPKATPWPHGDASETSHRGLWIAGAAGGAVVAVVLVILVVGRHLR